MNGTAEERTDVLDAMEPEMRTRVLAGLPANVVAFTPEYKDEADKAQKSRQEERQAQNRRSNPQLRDLLNPEQMADVRSGERTGFWLCLRRWIRTKRADVVGQLPPKSQALVPEFRREGQLKRTPRLVPSEDLKEASVFRAVYSNRQLEEVLVDFWFNHFNVDSTKNVAMTQNLGHLLIGSYERDAIRPHVLGHFKDLLLATARHPGMLYYLDNWESMAPDAFDVGPFAPRRGTLNGVPNSIIPNGLQRLAHGLNENYGREVMELHTLGVKGGYTQDDVIAVARCFTGWTVRSPEHPEFVFAPFMHDFGEKTVLGHKIPAGGGEQDGLPVIDILAHHPSTAKFISLQLARHFVADDPPQALVDRMAQTFTKTDGDLRAVIETMFKSPEFFSEGAWEAQDQIASGYGREHGSRDGRRRDRRLDSGAENRRHGRAALQKTGTDRLSRYRRDVAEHGGTYGADEFRGGRCVGSGARREVDASRWKGMDSAAIARDLLGQEASQQTLDAIGTGLQGKDPSPSVIASFMLGSPDFERR